MVNKKLICKNCGKEIILCNWLGHGVRHGDLKCKGYIHLKGPYYHKCDLVRPVAEIYLNHTPAKPDLMLEVNLQGKTLTASETGGIE